jgi:hypothetical protein
MGERGSAPDQILATTDEQRVDRLDPYAHADRFLQRDGKHRRRRTLLVPRAVGRDMPRKKLTAGDFRRIALGMKDALEASHMDHPDFRVNGRIFATLHADMEWGMVNLRPEEQQRFVQDAPEAFKPENGAWGLQGMHTAVRLDRVDEETLGEALTLAWRHRAEQPRAPRSKPRRPSQARRR